jgi:hypothetical protein
MYNVTSFPSVPPIVVVVVTPSKIGTDCANMSRTAPVFSSISATKARRFSSGASTVNAGCG